VAEGLPDRHDERAHGGDRRNRGKRPAGVLQGDDPCAQIVDLLVRLLRAMAEQSEASLDACVRDIEAAS